MSEKRENETAHTHTHITASPSHQSAVHLQPRIQFSPSNTDHFFEAATCACVCLKACAWGVDNKVAIQPVLLHSTKHHSQAHLLAIKQPTVHLITTVTKACFKQKQTDSPSPAPPACGHSPRLPPELVLPAQPSLLQQSQLWQRLRLAALRRSSSQTPCERACMRACVHECVQINTRRWRHTKDRSFIHSMRVGLC